MEVSSSKQNVWSSNDLTRENLFLTRHCPLTCRHCKLLQKGMVEFQYMLHIPLISPEDTNNQILNSNRVTTTNIFYHFCSLVAIHQLTGCYISGCDFTVIERYINVHPKLVLDISVTWLSVFHFPSNQQDIVYARFFILSSQQYYHSMHKKPSL